MSEAPRAGRSFVLGLVGLAAAAAGVALAVDKDFRGQVLASAKALEDEIRNPPQG